MTRFVPLYRRRGATRWGVDEPTGFFAAVDDDDFERVSKFGIWRLHNHGYAVAKQVIDEKRTTVLMHRLVLDVRDSSIHVDHRDHDTLNNRRSNLRAGTQRDNNRNTPDRPRRDSSSRFKGVGRFRGGWRAQGFADGKTVWLGKFSTEDEARAAYLGWKESA